MAIIKSVSGIRGTIGGAVGENLTPYDLVILASALGMLLKKKHRRPKLVIGRDARVSGSIVQNLVSHTLLACGVDVCDTGLTTTPTLAMSVGFHQAQAGVMISASHNPEMWNALKILDEKGEFIDESTGQEIYRLAEQRDFDFAHIDALGNMDRDLQAIQKHIDAILALDLVKPDKIAEAEISVVLDAVNSTGSIAVPMLLRALGVKHITVLNDQPTGRFAHDPEPLEANLTEICQHLKGVSGNAVGFAVDPDVDRLAIIDENGDFFGEEYTLVACADYVMVQHFNRSTDWNPATVSNLSSSQALSKLTEKYNFSHQSSAVGEFHVVQKMKATRAAIGGEGNGGVILPDLHYGRDALVGIALFLSYMSDKGMKSSEIRALYPNYSMVKKKVRFKPGVDVMSMLDSIARQSETQKISRIDGLKMEWKDQWVHIRASNTEPVLRIYAEALTLDGAAQLADKYAGLISNF